MSETMNKLGQVIIISLILVISIMAIRMWYFNTEGYTLDEKCRVSVEAHANLVKVGLPAKDSDIHCQAKEITLSENDNVKRLLAEDMKRCWTNYGKGKLTLFKGEGLLCSICTIIDPKDDLKIEGFNQYVSETPMKGSQQTYLEYITEFETEDFKHITNSELYRETSDYEEEIIELSKDKKYANIFIYAKGEYGYKKWKNIAEDSTTGLSLMGVGAATMIVTGIGLQGIPLIGTVVGGVLIIGGVGYTIVTAHLNSAKFEHLSRVELIPYTPNLLETLGCTHIPVSLIDE